MATHTKVQKPAHTNSNRFYTVLGVDRQASPVEIREAYKQVAKRLHPDKSQQQESQAFKELQNVYQVLSNDNTRKIYDLYGEEGLSYANLRAMSKKDTTAEELGDKILKTQNQKKKLWFAENFGLTGQTVMETSTSFLKDLFLLRRPLSEVETFSCSQHYRYPITPQHRLMWSTFVHSRNGAGSHEISLTHEYDIPETSHRLVSKVHFKHTTSEVWFGLRTPVDRYTTLKNFYVWDSRHHTLNLRLGLNRRLFLPFLAPFDPNIISETPVNLLYGDVTFNAGSSTGITSALKLLGKQYDVTLRSFFRPTSMGLSGFFRMVNRTRDMGINFGGSLNVPFDWRISAGTTMDITKETDFGIENSISHSYGVNVNLRFSRWGQTLLVPFNVDAMPSFFSGLTTFLCSTITVFLFHYVFIQPQKNMKLERKREKMRKEMEQRKQDALSYIEAMQWTIKNQVESEKRRPGGGLSIRYAQYGDLSKQGILKNPSPNRWISDVDADSNDSEIIDVSSALQLLMKDSRLQLTNAEKHLLQGFWDPCPEKEKYLEVFYVHQGVQHRALIKDSEALVIPSNRT